MVLHLGLALEQITTPLPSQKRSTGIHMTEFISKSHCFVSKKLILPECMKLLPLYVNCIIKNDALSGGK